MLPKVILTVKGEINFQSSVSKILNVRNNFTSVSEEKNYLIYKKIASNNRNMRMLNILQWEKIFLKSEIKNSIGIFCKKKKNICG